MRGTHKFWVMSDEWWKTQNPNTPLASKIWRKFTPSSMSQSLKLEASSSIAIPYSLGKANWKGWSPYPSCQNLTLFPIPTKNWVFLLKPPNPYEYPLHKPHPWTPLPSLVVHPPHSSPNFEATALLHSRVSLFPNHQSYFPSKALLKVVSFLIPKPLLAIGPNTLSHLTKWVLLSPYKKSLCNFSILLAT